MWCLASSVLVCYTFSWLYALLLTIDAGFRLKSKDRKTNTNPALGNGWGHLVPQEPYEEHLKKYGDQEEVRMLLIIDDLG
jgi:hypothetical protein